MVDLSLASSYVPAIVFYAKSLFMSISAYYAFPLGGSMSIGLTLIIDRVFFNSDYIMDVNASVAAIYVFMLINYERSRTACSCVWLSTVISIGWVLCSIINTIRVGILHWRHELQVYWFIFVVISFTQWVPETLTYLIARVSVFSVTISIHLYSKLTTKDANESILLILSRHGSMMIAPIPIMLIAAIVPNLSTIFTWKHSLCQVNPEYDAEAAALREALACRKEKNSQ